MDGACRTERAPRRYQPRRPSQSVLYHCVQEHLETWLAHCRDDPTYRHEPKVHVNYQETVLRIKDGLPKMRDVPKEMGGSGETLPE